MIEPDQISTPLANNFIRLAEEEEQDCLNSTSEQIVGGQINGRQTGCRRSLRPRSPPIKWLHAGGSD